MRGRGRAIAVALMLLVAVLALAAGATLLVALVLVAAAAGSVLLPAARWRPERAALVLAVLIVAGGGIAAGVRVVDGIADSRVDYHGELDTQQVLRTFHPAGPDPVDQLERAGYGHIESARGVMTVPHADGWVLVLWSIQELAPWLLAAGILVLLAPILRAVERGDPFRAGAAERLAWIGTLLLVGIPAIALLRYVVAEAASTGTFAEPVAEPTVTLSLVQVLPGVLVLALARIFRSGVELRDLERHTV
jgi:hypothetical protein